MLRKQFKELLDAFYGSIERFVCEYDGAILRYAFFGRRAASFIRLAAAVADGSRFVVGIGQTISSRWNLPAELLFELPAGTPIGVQPRRVELKIAATGGDLVFDFGKCTWRAVGIPVENGDARYMSLTLNPSKMARYKV